MKHKIFVLMTLAFCSLTTLVGATEQMGEKIIIGRDTLWMLSLPLSADTTLVRKVRERIDPKEMSTGLWKRYWGTWRLENETLYLEEVRSPWGNLVNIDGIFDAYRENGRIVARWFSGEIEVFGGESIGFDIFGRRYEHETVYTLSDGVVMRQKEIRNSLKKGANNEYAYTLNVLFNGKGMEWEGDSSLIVSVIPKPNGKTGKVRVTSYYPYTKQYYDTARIWEHDEEEKLYGKNHPYVLEIKKCLDLMDDWKVLKLDGKIQPVRLCVKWGGDLSKPRKFWWMCDEPAETDSLEIDNNAYVLRVSPLQQEPDMMTRLRPRLKGAFTTRNPRGYIARWRIADGQLWLMEIVHGRTGERIPLSTIEPGNHGEPVVASWYSGLFEVETRSRVGEEEDNGGILRQETVFEVKDGQVVHQTVNDDYIQPGDTASYNQFIRTVRSHDWDSYPELENRSLSASFIVYSGRNGVADSIRNICLHVFGKHEGEYCRQVIADPADPWVTLVRRAAEAVSRWEVRFFGGKVLPLDIFLI